MIALILKPARKLARSPALLMRRAVTRTLLLAPITAALAACGAQTISPELRYIMAQPIRCDTATDEIALLRKVRPDQTRQTLTVLNSVSPPGLAGMVVTQDYENRRRVVSGEHGADIDRRIAEIEARCGRR
jgi:hypothetical protein